jgi:hypothetical protein
MSLPGADGDSLARDCGSEAPQFQHWGSAERAAGDYASGSTRASDAGTYSIASL